MLAKPGQYAVLAAGQSPVVAQQIEAMHLEGVYTQATTLRQYPGAHVAANVIGTVHSDGTGAAGIEYSFNNQLAGKDGSLTYAVDNLGNVNPASRTVRDAAEERRDGRAHDRPEPAVRRPAVPRRGRARVGRAQCRGGRPGLAHRSGAHDGVVGDVRRQPTPTRSIPNVPINPPVMSAFEPGSVQKAITFAAALQQGMIKPSIVGDHRAEQRSTSVA